MSKISLVKQNAHAILKRMSMVGNLRSHGFTIVETMIVLGVSAALFVAVASTLSTSQNRTEFVQSVQDIRSQLQQTINEVSSGFYPATNNFSCTANPGGAPQISTGTPNKQGTNAGCIFLGKVVQFGVPGSTNEEFRTYTVAGTQKNSAGNDVGYNTSTFNSVDFLDYTQAKPVVVTPDSSNVSGLPTSSGKLLYGVTTLRPNCQATNPPTQPCGMWYNYDSSYTQHIPGYWVPNGQGQMLGTYRNDNWGDNQWSHINWGKVDYGPTSIDASIIVNHNWGYRNSPEPNIGGQYWSADWTGYFWAPQTGWYQFGSNIDDQVVISVNGISVFGSWSDAHCNDSGQPCFGNKAGSQLGNADKAPISQPVYLTAGQPVPLDVKYAQYGDGENIQLLVRAFQNASDGDVSNYNESGAWHGNPSNQIISPTIIPTSWISQDKTWVPDQYIPVIVNGQTEPVGAVAFLNSLASYDLGTGLINSGSQTLNVVPINGTNLGDDPSTAVQEINNRLNYDYETKGADPNNQPLLINPHSGVNLCFVSAGSNQSGLITIGSNGRQLSVTLTIKENKTCS